MSCEPPKRVRVVRCPQCGSTDAGSSESESFADLTFMACRSCGHHEFSDHWQIVFDWNVELELVPGQLPEFIEPLTQGEDLASWLARDRETKK